jgi:hypothetical protein
VIFVPFASTAALAPSRMAARLRAIGPVVRGFAVAVGEVTGLEPARAACGPGLPDAAAEPPGRLTLPDAAAEPPDRLTLPPDTAEPVGRLTLPGGAVKPLGAAAGAEPARGCAPGTGLAVVGRSTKSESGSGRRGELCVLIPRN